MSKKEVIDVSNGPQPFDFEIREAVEKRAKAIKYAKFRPTQRQINNYLTQEYRESFKSEKRTTRTTYSHRKPKRESNS